MLKSEIIKMCTSVCRVDGQERLLYLNCEYVKKFLVTVR